VPAVEQAFEQQPWIPERCPLGTAVATEEKPL